MNESKASFEYDDSITSGAQNNKESLIVIIGEMKPKS